VTFLNALLAFGAAAFAVPLVIHLLNRRKYLTVDWGAMHLLENTIRQNARRFQWKQLLLLLIRCSIPVLLAMAMARPMVQAWRNTDSSGAMSIAIVVDDSLSMLSEPPVTELSDEEAKAGRNRLQRACHEIESILRQLPTNSATCIVLGGSPVEVWSENDPGALIPKLQDLAKSRHHSGAFDLESATHAALDWMDRSSHYRRHVLVVSDFQNADWDPNQRAAIRQLSQSLSQQAIPIPWSFLSLTHASDEPQESEHVCIEDLEILPKALVSHATASFTATLRNQGIAEVQLPVVLQASGQEIERQSVRIGPKASASVRFEWKPPVAGDVEIRVGIDGMEPPPAGHLLSRVLAVRDPLRVLLVDGDQRNEPMRSESDYLRLALTPLALFRGELGDPFVTRVVDPTGWNDATLSQHQVVVCCNVPDLSVEQRNWLRNFVERGGGLVLCLGDRVQVDRYNGWELLSQGGIRPGSFAARSPWEGGVQVSNTPFFELSRPILDSLNGVRFEHRYEMTLESSQAWSGLHFDDGQPWLVAVPIGEGRSVWMMSACDDADSNLPSRPAFVPIAQKLMHFVGKVEGSFRCQEPGTAWRSALDAEVRLPRVTGTVSHRAGNTTQLMAVDVDTETRKRELDRRRLSVEAWKELTRDASARGVTDATQWLDEVRSQWNGRELWSWFWLALLAMFLLEMAVQQSLLPRTVRSASHPSAKGTSPQERGAA
jgi:hypothetical protein